MFFELCSAQKYYLRKSGTAWPVLLRALRSSGFFIRVRTAFKKVKKGKICSALGGARLGLQLEREEKPLSMSRDVFKWPRVNTESELSGLLRGSQERGV